MGKVLRHPQRAAALSGELPAELPTLQRGELVHPRDTASRMNIPMVPAQVTSSSDVFTDEVVHCVPPALGQRGISQQEWVECLHNLQHDVQVVRWSMLSTILASVCVLPVFCWACAERRYQARLAVWLSKCNSEVFQPKGMFIKTQTVEYERGEFAKQRSWLAVALTPDESAALAEEPHVWRLSRSGKNLTPESSACFNLCCGIYCCGVRRVV